MSPLSTVVCVVVIRKLILREMFDTTLIRKEIKVKHRFWIIFVIFDSAYCAEKLSVLE
jgi:hypothetical protein